MAMSAEHRLIKIYSPSPVMVSSPYEWNNLEWDEKPQTNKQKHESVVSPTIHLPINFSHIIFIPRMTGSISTKRDTKHPWLQKIRGFFFQMKGYALSLCEMIFIELAHWQLFKMFARTTEPVLTKLSRNYTLSC